jgi:superfamily II DNA/RNA helicase
LFPGVEPDKKYDHIEELTSRMNNSDLSEIIQVRLKNSYTNVNNADVYDFVLASNMISVGIDIKRLGLMVVAGQPKTNSEYIQSTSRIGRENPGLVITIYNGSRSRDRSHYEQFLKFHSALYQFVEATSLTPFSDRARDRGLHALFVALCRYKIPGLLANKQAASFMKNLPGVGDIIEEIEKYIKTVDPKEFDAAAAELEEIADEWEFRTEGGLVYKNYFNNAKEKDLLKDDTKQDRFRTMNSLRNVDKQAGIYLLGRN